MIAPFARKYTGHKSSITQLQRMGTGLVISIFAMLSARVLEVIRLGIVKRNNYYDLEHIPMSIFWQVPQYFLIGTTTQDMGNHPGSEQNTYADIEAAYRCLEETYDVKEEDVILYGQSVGSGPTLDLASRLLRLRTVVLHSPV
ncbi:hypothetical protein L1887_42425 [Cichorium endivia]|nr:hypothetical protein L1887_42425 [Cichorium endivia]